MTVKTRFRIYYIDPITSSNNLMDFREPNAAITTEKTATLAVGARTHTDLATEIERALNDAGEETYTVTFNRSTRTFTISASDTFELLAATGSSVGSSPYSLIGFTADQTGLSSYTGLASGTNYVPQFKPQDYLDFEDNIEGVEASVNQSPSGVTESVTFGDIAIMEFNLRYATNEFHAKGSPITNNLTGKDELNTLMKFLVKKRNVEYMKDESDVNDFDTIQLESTPESRQGISYRLKDQVRQGFDEHFETGKLRFRRID